MNRITCNTLYMYYIICEDKHPAPQRHVLTFMYVHTDMPTITLSFHKKPTVYHHYNIIINYYYLLHDHRKQLSLSYLSDCTSALLIIEIDSSFPSCGSFMTFSPAHLKTQSHHIIYTVQVQVQCPVNSYIHSLCS